MLDRHSRQIFLWRWRSTVGEDCYLASSISNGHNSIRINLSSYDSEIVVTYDENGYHYELERKMLCYFTCRKKITKSTFDHSLIKKFLPTTLDTFWDLEKDLGLVLLSGELNFDCRFSASIIATIERLGFCLNLVPRVRGVQVTIMSPENQSLLCVRLLDRRIIPDLLIAFSWSSVDQIKMICKQLSRYSFSCWSNLHHLLDHFNEPDSLVGAVAAGMIQRIES